MVSDDDLLKAYKEAGNNATAAAASLGIPARTCRERIRNLKLNANRSPSQALIKTRSLTDFLETYDRDTVVPKKIREALTQLGSRWLYENEFIRMAGVSQSDLAMYREDFHDYVLITPKDKRRVWFGNADNAAAMRSKI